MTNETIGKKILRKMLFSAHKAVPLKFLYGPVGFFYSRVFYPLKSGYRAYRSFEKFLDESQWWSRQRLDDYQLAQLKALLAYASSFVPYYKDLFKKLRLTPDDFKSLEDLGKIPVLTRQEAKENVHALLAPSVNKKKVFRGSSSGSTAIPLEFFFDSGCEQYAKAHMEWRKTLMGLKKSDASIRIWGGPFAKETDAFMFHWLALRQLSLQSLLLDERRMFEFLSVIRELKPAFIVTRASLMHALALFAHEQGVQDIQFPAFVSNGENLYDFQKTAIMGQFKCRIFNWYGLEEAGCIAFDCQESERLHVDPRKGILEVVGQAGEKLHPGNPGKLVYTNFFNYLMPLIRYETNDVGVLSAEECPCKRHMQQLQSVDGRLGEVVRFEGGYLRPKALLEVIERSIDVKECQFVQESTDIMAVNIVKKDPGAFCDIEKIAAQLSIMTNGRIRFKIDFVGSIPRSIAGKFRLVVPAMRKE